MDQKSLSEYESLMDKADPDNTGQALNLITYDKEKGKSSVWNPLQLYFTRLPSISRSSGTVAVTRDCQLESWSHRSRWKVPHRQKFFAQPNSSQ